MKKDPHKDPQKIKSLYKDISQFEPLFPSKTERLEQLARRLVESSSQLVGRHSPIFIETLKNHLRIVNSFYSNLIEGHSTHPIDIERAMRDEYSDDDEKRDLQIESKNHIRVQEVLSKKLISEPETNVTSSEFLLDVHSHFYEEMPERLRIVRSDGGGEERVKAGEFRDRQVVVGRHLPPAADSLSEFMKRFDMVYNPNQMYGLKPLIAIAAAHHRLMWIHPFLDGNGRVVRLFTDAYLEKIELKGYGVWNVSRGLARRRDEYKSLLAAADTHRLNDLDGRWNLSDQKLTEFCEFFLKCGLDQAEFMNNSLALDGIAVRLESYAASRDAGIILDEKGEKLPPLPKGTVKILKELLIKGELVRGEIPSIINRGDRTATNTIGHLIRERILTSLTKKSKVRLGLPSHVVPYWLPNLYPNQVL